MIQILTHIILLAVLLIIVTWPKEIAELFLYTGKSLIYSMLYWGEHLSAMHTLRFVPLKCSGDHDLVFPYIGTKKWIHTLGLGVDITWTPWLVNKQVAGYVSFPKNVQWNILHLSKLFTFFVCRYTEEFSRDAYSLTFATVKVRYQIHIDKII